MIRIIKITLFLIPFIHRCFAADPLQDSPISDTILEDYDSIPDIRPVERGQSWEAGASLEESENGCSFFFYNVGQGNGTFFIDRKNKNFCIIDAGSSKLPYGPQALLPQSRADLSEHFFTTPQHINLSWRIASNTVFIVSHPDIDHFNLITRYLRERRQDLLPQQCFFYLGGHERRYAEGNEGAGLLEGIRRLLGPQALVGTHIEFLNNGAEISDRPIAQLADRGRLKFDILIANVEGDDNTSGAVVFVEFLGRTILLPGDATETTFNRIRQQPGRQDSLNVHTLLASHHGAQTHGSNDLEWTEFCSPKRIIISAGRHRSYYHPPYYNVVRHFITYLRRQPSIERQVGVEIHDIVAFIGGTLTPQRMGNEGYTTQELIAQLNDDQGVEVEAVDNRISLENLRELGDGYKRFPMNLPFYTTDSTRFIRLDLFKKYFFNFFDFINGERETPKVCEKLSLIYEPTIQEIEVERLYVPIN